MIGNRLNGKFIAGLVYIAQRSDQAVQGFITAIDLTTGHFQINGGTDCVINDPTGRYGRAYTASPLWYVVFDCLPTPAYIFKCFERIFAPFHLSLRLLHPNSLSRTADPDNPSIHTQTGFPVCIPRNSSDPLCPSKNRPLGSTGAPLNILSVPQ